MNRELKGLPKGDAAKKFANLNEVGTCLWLKGEALRQKGRPDRGDDHLQNVDRTLRICSGLGQERLVVATRRRRLANSSPGSKPRALTSRQSLRKHHPPKRRQTRAVPLTRPTMSPPKRGRRFAEKDWEGVVNHADRAVNVLGAEGKADQQQLENLPQRG